MLSGAPVTSRCATAPRACAPPSVRLAPTTRDAGRSTRAAARSSSPCTVRTLPACHWKPASSLPSYATVSLSRTTPPAAGLPPLAPAVVAATATAAAHGTTGCRCRHLQCIGAAHIHLGSACSCTEGSATLCMTCCCRRCRTATALHHPEYPGFRGGRSTQMLIILLSYLMPLVGSFSSAVLALFGGEAAPFQCTDTSAVKLCSRGTTRSPAPGTSTQLPLAHVVTERLLAWSNAAPWLRAWSCARR